MSHPIIPEIFSRALEQIMLTEYEKLQLLRNSWIDNNSAIDGLNDVKFFIKYFYVNHETKDEQFVVLIIERQNDRKLFEREFVFDKITGEPKLSQYNNKIVWTENKDKCKSIV